MSNQLPPWPPPPGARPMIAPPSLGSMAATPGVPWYRRQVFQPEPFFPDSPSIGLQLRRRVVDTVSGVAAGTQVVRTVQFDIPAAVYALVGSSILTTNADMPVGRDSRDQFLVQFTHSNGDRFDTGQCLGSLLLGDAKLPALLGGTGWMMDRGASIQILITPNVANLRIDLCLWCIEVRGPANYSVTG